jgi:DNA-binding beta-propeller fold protein YncE
MIPFSQDLAGLAVAPDTLYFDVDPNFDLGATGYVGVLDTRHCQAADTTQCTTQTPPTVTVGEGPTAAVVDPAHHTLYVPDNANGDSAGLVSMIDTRHCNGDVTSDCTGQIPPTTRVGRSPLGAVLDPPRRWIRSSTRCTSSTTSTARCRSSQQTIEPSGATRLGHSGQSPESGPSVA